MTVVARSNTPEQDRATGAVTPLIRAATHIGYALGGLASATQETWEASHALIVGDCQHEFGQAVSHMTISPLFRDDNPYTSPQATAAVLAVIGQLNNAVAADYEDLRTLIETASNLAHNIAYAAEFIDRDAFGIQDASAGRSQ